MPAILALVAGGNGIVQLVAGSATAGGALLAVGAASALGCRAVVRRRHRTTAAPLDPADTLVVLDLAAQVLADGSGQVLAPLAAVRIERAVQATSSSRSLRVAWPGGTAVVYRGDPLVPRGSIEAAVNALQERGVPVA